MLPPSQHATGSGRWLTKCVHPCSQGQHRAEGRSPPKLHCTEPVGLKQKSVASSRLESQFRKWLPAPQHSPPGFIPQLWRKFPMWPWRSYRSFQNLRKLPSQIICLKLLALHLKQIINMSTVAISSTPQNCLSIVIKCTVEATQAWEEKHLTGCHVVL